jgi:hypothetical protein
MLRFSSLIVILTLFGCPTISFAAQGQSKSSQCYNEQACMAACSGSGGHYCNLWCQRRAAELPPCKG